MQALVVDDDLISRMALVDLMGRFPELSVQQAETGEQAWKMLESGLQPVICLFDVRMPDINGVTLLRRLRIEKRLSEVPVVFVTSASDKTTVLDSARLRVATYIVKPFDAAHSYGRVREVLDEAIPKLAEPAAVTMQRLDIDTERYLLYVESLVEQTNLLRPNFIDPALRRDLQAVDRIKTGAITLGLWHAARMLEGIVASCAPGVKAQTRGDLFNDLLGHLQDQLDSVAAT